MKAIVDPDICIGCGLCADTCPGVYRMEGDKAVTCVDLIPAEQHECARKGAEECPVEAIKIADSA